MSDNEIEKEQVAEAEVAVAEEAAGEASADVGAADETPPVVEGDVPEEAPAAESESPDAPEETPPVVEGEAPDAPQEAAPATESPDESVAESPPKQRGRRRSKLEDLVVGTETSGKVVGLAKFGCFVDIGAVTDGLVHITEFPKKGVRNVEDVVKSGDEVDVWIKDVDLKSNRISLSMRRKPQRPIGDLKPDDVLTGTVTSVTKYGAFVDIGSDTEGLVHISEMSSGYVERPGEVVKSGEPIEVRIKEIDRQRARISLSMVGLANDTGTAADSRGSASAADMQAADEPQERMPTVVELALRRALGEMQDEAEIDEPQAEPVEEPAASDEPEAEDGAASDTLGEVYERMLAEYRATKAEE